MIVFTADCDRDLKREEAAASMALPAAAGAGVGKKKEAGASERRVPLASLLPNQSTAGARPAGAGKKMEEATAKKKKKEATAKKRKMEATTKEKMKEATAEKMEGAVASESGDAALSKEKEGDSLWKEGVMLKLREDFWQADDLWIQMREKAVWGTSTVESKINTQTVNKKRKLIRVIWPDACIDDIIEDPCMMKQPSDEEMAKCSEEYRQSYAMLKIVDAKKRAYHQALIEQHRAFGFAYDEVEVTDDEEEVMEGQGKVAVVKN